MTVADICDGFVYNQLEGKGLFGLGGKLTIQPEYQRNYIYAEGGGKKEVEKAEHHGGGTIGGVGQPVFCSQGVMQPGRGFEGEAGANTAPQELGPRRHFRDRIGGLR